MSRGFGRRRRTRIWRASCSPKASTSTGFERSEIISSSSSGPGGGACDRGSLNTCSSERGSWFPLTLAYMDAALRLWNRRSPRCLPKAVPVNHFAFPPWRGEHVHSFIVPALRWILSNAEGLLKRLVPFSVI